MATRMVLFWIIMMIVVTELISSSEHSCLDGCQVKPHIKCTISTVSCDAIDLDASHADLWPNSPTSLSASVFTDLNEKLAINLTWGLPDDASYSELTGFILRILYMKSDGAHCVHFDMTGTEWQSTDILSHVPFHYSCFPDFKYDSQYYIQLQSVPFGVLNLDHMYLETPVDTDSGCWDTFITIKEHRLEQCSCSVVEVSFILSPGTPEHYSVRLISTNGSESERRVRHIPTNTSGVVTFENVCPGSYRIELEQSQFTATGECVCGSADYINCYQCCIIETLEFHILPTEYCTRTTSQQPTPTEPENKSEGYLPVWWVGLFLLAITIMVSLLVVLVYCMRCQKNTQNNHYEVKTRNDSIASSEGWHSPQPSWRFTDNSTVDMQRRLDEQSEVGVPVTNGGGGTVPVYDQTTAGHQNQYIPHTLHGKEEGFGNEKKNMQQYEF